MKEIGEKQRGQYIPIIMQVGMFLFVSVKLFPMMKDVNCYVHSLMSMNLFMDTTDVTKTLDIIPNYVSALFLFGCVSIVMALVFRLVYGRNRNAAFALLAYLFLWIYIWNSVTVTGKIDGACATKYAQYYLSH